MSLAMTLERPMGWRFAALVFLALLNAAAAIGKGLDLAGFVRVLEAYDLLPGLALPAVALGLPLVEAALAGALLSARWWREAALATALLCLAYGLVLTLTLLRGIELQNCGCFGVFFARPLRPWTPLEDLALMALALWVARR
jgi:hypothetical protein